MSYKQIVSPARVPAHHAGARATAKNKGKMQEKEKMEIPSEPIPRRRLNVLVACEESQAECMAFRSLGHQAFSCDIQPCRKTGNPHWHIQGDVTPYLEGQTYFITQAGDSVLLSHWDLIIAHPPCTYLCKLSSCQMYKEPAIRVHTIKGWLNVNIERWQNLKKGRAFFFKCLAGDAPYVAVENPIPMEIADLPRPDAFACPSWYGVKYTKKTCYWLRNLPPLMAGVEYPEPKSYVNASRGKYRSRTFPELANALADQWSRYILDEIDRREDNPK